MYVKLHKQQLSDALQTVAKVVENRSYHQFVKLTTSGEYLTLQATNLERFLTIKVPVEEISVDFSVCVDADKFAKLVKELDNEIIIEPKETYLFVKSGSTKAKLLVSDYEIPEFPEPVYDVEFESKPLREAIERVSFAIGSNRDHLKCLLIDGKGDKTNFVGSDGFRLVVYEYPVNFDKQFKIHVIGLTVLKDLLDDVDTVKLGATENMTFISTELWELSLRNIESDYPDYESVIPSDYSCKVVFTAEEMGKALKKLLIFGKDASAVEMFVGGAIILKTQSPDYGEIEVSVPVEEVSGETHIAFDGRYLKEFTDNANGRIVMKLVDADSPMVFREYNTDYIYVLMPMRL